MCSAKDERDVPIEVSVSVNIRKLISIDVERQTFRAEVWIRSSWVDDSLDELWQKNERVYFADPVRRRRCAVRSGGNVT